VRERWIPATIAAKTSKAGRNWYARDTGWETEWGNLGDDLAARPRNRT
jgi:hypothetical protein